MIDSGTGISSTNHRYVLIVALAVSMAGMGIVLITTVQLAYGDLPTLIFLQDQQSCEDSPVNGDWDAGTNTCTLFFGLTLTSPDDLEIESGVTAALPNNTQSVIGTGRTLFVASGGTLAIEGELVNAGTLSNSGILTVRNPSGVATGILSNGTLTNSGLFVVSNGDILNIGALGFHNAGLMENSGTLMVNNTGGIGVINDLVINNSGTISLFPSDLAQGMGNSGTINNSGIFNINNTSISSGRGMDNTGTLDNHGTLNLGSNGGIGLRILNGGIVSNYENMTISNTGGTGIENDATGTLTNNGILAVSSTGTMLTMGEFNNAGTLDNAGTLLVENYQQDTTGISNTGFINNAGTLIVNNTGGVFIPFGSGGSFHPSVGIENIGTITNTGTLYLDNTGDINRGIDNDGIIDNSGSLTVSNFGRHAEPTYDNRGITNCGTISNSGILTVENNGNDNSGIHSCSNDGIIDNSGILNVKPKGVFTFGIEHFSGTLTNSGTLNVNISVGSTATGIWLLRSSSSIINSGTLNVNSTGSGLDIFSEGGMIDNIGTLNVISGGILNQQSQFGNFGVWAPGIIKNSGTLAISNGGGIGNRGGTINNTDSGTFIIHEGGIFSNVRSSLTLSTVNNYVLGTISNNGTINNGEGGTINNSGTIDNHVQGTVDNKLDATINNPGTINNYCGTIINSGGLTGNSINDLCDSDNDGISDSIDIQPGAFSNDFADFGSGGNTTGTIISRGGQTLSIQDATNSTEGVRVHADPSGSGNATQVSVCGGSAIYTVSAGDDFIVTCGSVTTQVVQGPAEVEFVGEDGSTASATIEAGNSLTFYPDTFSFLADLSNTTPISVIIGGNTVNLDPGETVDQLPITIDIKPDGTPNSINIKKDKTVTVALFGSSSLNVNSIDISSVKFGGHKLQPAIKSSPQKVNKDAFMDLVFQFKVSDLEFAISDTKGCLSGLILDGTPFVGCDSVKILNK